MPVPKLIDYALLVSYADGKALRTVAKKYQVPSGAIRLLNAVLFRDTIGKSTSASQLQAQKVASKTLIRAQTAALITAGLLERQRGRGPWLRLTMQAHTAGHLFQRNLRELTNAFERAH